MYLYSSTSSHRRIHTQQCPYAAKIQKDHLVSLHTLEGITNPQPCFLCSRLGIAYRKERKDIDAFCQKYHFTCQWQDGYLQVNGPVDSWRIVYSFRMKRIAIYHKNSTHHKWPQHEELPYEYIEGYHRQNWPFLSILSALRMMLDHQKVYLHRGQLPRGMREYVREMLPESQKPPRPGLSKKRREREERNAKRFERRQKAIRVLQIIEGWEK